jgi:UDP-N-acetylglucosamine 3-dehydrogenase
MLKKTRVAVIGGGNMGLNHVRKYLQMKEVTLVAVADPNPAIASMAEEHRIGYYGDYNEMLEVEALDAVSVVVPTHLHYKIAKNVLQRGVNCLLEKPITSTIEEAQELIVLAKQDGLILTVGHVEHYNPMVSKLKEVITDGEIADVTSIVCRRVGGFPPREPATDVILDLAVHDVGVMNYLLGKIPLSVASHASRTHHTSKIDAAELLLDYGNASGFVQVNWTTPIKVRSIAITGTKGYIEANYLTQEIVIYDTNIQKTTNENFEVFIRHASELKHRTIKTKFEEPLLLELKSFIAHVNGDTATYLVTAEEAAAALLPTLEVSKRHTTL